MGSFASTPLTAPLLAAALVACGRPAPAPQHEALPPPPATEVLLHEDGVQNAYPRLAHDGQRILYQSDRTGRWQLYILDLATGTSTRPLSDSANNTFVDWSADHAWIAFVSDRDGNEELYRVRTDGTGLERLTHDPARDIHPYFSPDGRYLLFNSTRGNGSLDLYRLELASKGVERLTATPEEETCARYSPDMGRIVFLRNDEATDDLFVMDVATGRTENVTGTPEVTDGWPVFSPDAAWIYYSTMASGSHRVHRMRAGGGGDTTLTFAGPGEEDGRAYISSDGRTLIFNRRTQGAIDIRRLRLT